MGQSIKVRKFWFAGIDGIGSARKRTNFQAMPSGVPVYGSGALLRGALAMENPIPVDPPVSGLASHAPLIDVTASP
jgi:hypothetical protein